MNVIINIHVSLKKLEKLD